MSWKKFRELSLGGKLQWIAQYYGVTIVIAALAVYMLVIVVQSVFGPAEDYALRIMILDDRQSADICRMMSAELSEALSGECEVTSYLKRDDDQRQAFAVRLMTDHLDIVIAPVEQTQQLLQNSFLQSAMELGADAFYYELTGGGPASGNETLCLGVVASGRNADNVPAAVDYFTRGK